MLLTKIHHRTVPWLHMLIVVTSKLIWKLIFAHKDWPIQVNITFYIQTILLLFDWRKTFDTVLNDEFMNT